MNTNQKGFTLIELLVVIAIIGILAALVLVALGNARDKANDARIKSDIGQLRTLAEVHYDGNNASYQSPKSLATCYGTPNSTNCAGGIENSVSSLETDLTAAGSGALVSNSNASAFCISDTLKSDSTQILCVDNTGQFKQGTAETCPVGAACP
jgi:prepilin-type N-terminal cleavage/methylation domain-containing protein